MTEPTSPEPTPDAPSERGRYALVATRALELILVIACFVIASLSFWRVYGALREPITADSPRSTQLAIAYVVGFVASVAALLGARLVSLA